MKPAPDLKFVTAINCMDGRVQEPAIKFLKNKYGADYVDMITEPGPVGILSDGAGGTAAESIRKRVDISVNIHGSRVIAVFAHQDCAGDPVAKEMQIKQLAKSIERVRSWGLGCEIIGCWIDENRAVNAVI